MLLTKKYISLRYLYNHTLKSILFLCSFLLLFILLMVCLKRTYINPQLNVKPSSSVETTFNDSMFIQVKKFQSNKLRKELKQNTEPFVNTVTSILSFQRHKSNLKSKLAKEVSSEVNDFQFNKIKNVDADARFTTDVKIPVLLVSQLKSNLESKVFPTANEVFSSKFIEVSEFKLKTMKKFDNEDARPIGFPMNKTKNLTINDNSQKVIYLATKYFNEWNPKHFYFLHLGNATFTRYPCPISSCFVTNNPSDIHISDAILFHVRDLEVFSIPSYRTAEQIWILYSMEPPWLEIKDMRRFNGVFNWTMSYRRNSNVLMKYGFIGKIWQNLKKPNLDYLFNRKANKAVWYVSNCQTDSNREEYVARLRKVYSVDIIGGCGIEACRPAERKRCYHAVESGYKFYLAFENALCRDYVTEKLFNSLAYRIIPVTLGGVNYSEIAPNHSVINALEFESPEELGHYLWKVSLNKTLYMSYFSWKDIYKSFLQPWMCDLCEKLHNPPIYTTNDDLESWWNEDNSCQRWSEKGLKPIEKHAFPKYHTKLFE